MAFNLFAGDHNSWIQETAQNWVTNGTSTDVTVTFVDDDNKLSYFQCHKLIISVIVGKEYPLSLLKDVDNIIFADIGVEQFENFLEKTLAVSNKVEVKKEKEIEIPQNDVVNNIKVEKSGKKKVVNTSPTKSYEMTAELFDFDDNENLTEDTLSERMKPTKDVFKDNLAVKKKRNNEKREKKKDEKSKQKKRIIKKEKNLDAIDIKSEVKKKVTVGQKGGICSFCGYKTNHTGRLREHQRKHTGEKPEICVYCKKGFSERKTLDVHKRIHTGEKPYKCKFCDVCFSQRTGVKSHFKSHHKDKILSDSEKEYEFISPLDR